MLENDIVNIRSSFLNYVICNPAHTNDKNVQHFLGNMKSHLLPILLL